MRCTLSTSDEPPDYFAGVFANRLENVKPVPAHEFRCAVWRLANQIQEIYIYSAEDFSHLDSNRSLFTTQPGTLR